MSNACRNKSTNKNPIFKEYGKGLVLLHGTLEISIDEAKDLPDMESKNYFLKLYRLRNSMIDL